MTRTRLLRIAVPAGCILLGGTLAWARQKQKSAEDQVRAAAFRYYAGTIFGDADTCLAVSRMPLYIVRDGAFTLRDDKGTRALLASIAQRMKEHPLSDDDRKRVTANMIAVFDEASIQFIGANTAACTFLLRKGTKDNEGDNLATLLLHRQADKWRVIEEITDSAPVPPSYLQAPAER
ncbi:MAG: hypothetical protein ACP5VE_00600 [Chthonomonadales bacterium]